MRLGASVFLDSHRTRFHNKIDYELPEERFSDPNIPEARAMRSLPLNGLKPFLKRKVSQIIMKRVFRHRIVVNAFRTKDSAVIP